MVDTRSLGLRDLTQEFQESGLLETGLSHGAIEVILFQTLYNIGDCFRAFHRVGIALLGDH